MARPELRIAARRQAYLVSALSAVFLAPIQEMPKFGRNPVYISGLFLFVLFQIPVLFAKNFATILVFRFLAGFVGSPALATGGASMGGESACDTFLYLMSNSLTPYRHLLASCNSVSSFRFLGGPVHRR